MLTLSPLYSGPCEPFLVRLACLIHAASVRSEPGSNPSIGIFKGVPEFGHPQQAGDGLSQRWLIARFELGGTRSTLQVGPKSQNQRRVMRLLLRPPAPRFSSLRLLNCQRSLDAFLRQANANRPAGRSPLRLACGPSRRGTFRRPILRGSTDRFAFARCLRASARCRSRHGP